MLTWIDTPSGAVAVSVRRGLPAFQIPGIPDREVREVRERLRAAITNSGGDWPHGQIAVEVPRGKRLSDGRLELPIALGVLVASGQLDPGWAAGRWSGRLKLDGEIA